MVLASLIHGVEEFFLTGLISLAIVFATLRAYFAKLLRSMEAAGFSPFLMIYLLSILSIYGCIATIQCCTWCQQASADEECGITEDSIPKARPISYNWRWESQRLRFYKGRSTTKPVDEPSEMAVRGRR